MFSTQQAYQEKTTSWRQASRRKHPPVHAQMDGQSENLTAQAPSTGWTEA